MISALRSRNFRLLWLSQSISVVGDELVIVAVGLYVTRLTGKASDVGLVLAAYSVPNGRADPDWAAWAVPPRSGWTR